MRRLFYVPIIHAEADMGSIAEDLAKVSASADGETEWQDAPAVERFWRGLRSRVLELDLPEEGFQLYQDGLPVCGREVEIARQAAERGSANYQLLLELTERGGELTGTEDPGLLAREHAALVTYFEAQRQGDPEAAARYSETARALLSERDAFIRKRIADTLPAGGTGLIFLGAQHGADEGLPSDIQVDHLIHGRIFRRRGGGRTG
jgi:hypothetical protein